MMRERGAATIEVRADAQDRYNAALERRLDGTVWNTGCASWYLDRTGRNTTIWPDWTWRFRRRDRAAGPGRVRARRPGRRAGPGDRMSARVLLTGAAGGIGAAAARELRARGAHVVGLDLHAGDDIVACDVRDQGSVDRAVAEAVERLGGLDVLINNAGLGTPQSAGAAPDADALAVLDVNLIGPWRVTARRSPRCAPRAGA